MIEIEKVIIVEGKSDKKQLLSVISEPVLIVCTYGTFNQERIDEWSDTLYDKDVYIFVDADDAGEKLRKQLIREIPHAKHLYTQRKYRQVATTPKSFLAKLLKERHFQVYE